MTFTTIEDIHTPELHIYHQFREHAFQADGSFVADSPKVVNLLLESDIKIKSILATQIYYDTHKSLLPVDNETIFYVATKTQMQDIVGHKIHHNVMMHGIRPQDIPLDKLDDHIIMLDEISSTQNIGSIARSAAAIGINSYLLPSYGPHPYSRRALRVSMGHISLLKTHIYSDLTQTILQLKSYGYHIYAAEVTPTSTPLAKVKAKDKWVVLMGHEGFGLSDEILDLCDEVITIEMMEGIKSFNVGVAASLIMYTLKQS